MSQYVYAGAAPFSGAGHSEQPSGLYRTPVGEQDWHVLRNGLPEKVEVRTIAIHPTTPRTVYVGTQDGPYRSRDSGEHWERLPLPDKNMVVWSILLHPHNPRTLFVGTAPPAVYRSDDGGEHWRRLPIVEPAGMVQMGFPCRIIRLAADPSNPHELYGGATWRDYSLPAGRQDVYALACG